MCTTSSEFSCIKQGSHKHSTSYNQQQWEIGRIEDVITTIIDMYSAKEKRSGKDDILMLAVCIHFIYLQGSLQASRAEHRPCRISNCQY